MCPKGTLKWHPGSSCFPEQVLRVYSGSEKDGKAWDDFFGGKGDDHFHAVALVNPVAHRTPSFSKQVRDAWIKSGRDSGKTARIADLHMCKAKVIAHAIDTAQDRLHYVYMDMDTAECKKMVAKILEYVAHATLYQAEASNATVNDENYIADFAGGGGATSEAAGTRTFYQTLYDRPSTKESATNPDTINEQVCARVANRDSKLRIVFTNLAEGLDLKGVHFIHVVNWPRSMTTYYQLMGRGPRRCSHTNENERKVRTIYYEVSQGRYASVDAFRAAIKKNGRTRKYIDRYQLRRAAVQILESYLSAIPKTFKDQNKQRRQDVFVAHLQKKISTSTNGARAPRRCTRGGASSQRPSHTRWSRTRTCSMNWACRHTLR